MHHKTGWWPESDNIQLDKAWPMIIQLETQKLDPFAISEHSITENYQVVPTNTLICEDKVRVGKLKLIALSMSENIPNQCKKLINRLYEETFLLIIQATDTARFATSLFCSFKCFLNNFARICFCLKDKTHSQFDLPYPFEL